MSIIKEISYIFDKKQKRNLVFFLIAVLIGTIFELLGVTAVLPLISAMMNPSIIVENQYFNFIYTKLKFTNSNQFLIFLCFFIIVVFITKNLYLLLLGDLQFRFVSNNQRKLSIKVMETYMNQPYLFHTMHNSSELIRNVTGDTQVFYRAVLAMLQLFTDGSICISLFIFLFIQDVYMTLGIAFIFSFFVLIYFTVLKKNIKKLGELSRIYNAEMTKWILQAFGGIKEIQILNREMFFVKNYDKVYQLYTKSQRKYNVLSILTKPLVETLCIAGILIIVVFRLNKGVDLQTFIPILTTFAVAAFKILPSFNKITGNLGIVMFSKPSVEAVYEDLKKVNGLNEKQYCKKNIKAGIKFCDEIRIENLSFKYPENEQNVIENISFTIPKNSSIALVGPSGAGKTTLADIILGVLSPNDGHVYADKTDVHENLYEWHQKIGYIPQNIYLTDDTLRNNVAFGMIEEEINEESVWEALEKAQMKSFVESLPNGLDTVVGESGTRLSGGQRQRIGIARALYNNPEILVLDEATSALDNDTEKAVMDAIEQLAGMKTLIIIAHRLSTIENCDYIFEVKEKNIILKQKERK